MEITNIVDSISCVDFLNQVDNLIFKLLYEPNKGYCNLKAKDAIDEADTYIEEFENEVGQIVKESKNDIEDLIEEKRKEFIFKIKEHYFKQTNIWADDVYSNLINNCCLAAYSNKNDEYMLDKIYNRGLCGISWYINIKKYPKEIKGELLNDYNQEFNKSITSKDTDFLSKDVQKSDYKLFFKLYFMFLDDEEKFILKDFNSYNQKLALKDINYLNQLKSKAATSKRSDLKDEICLMKSAFEIMNFKEAKDKYDFLFEIDDDFKNYYSANKKLDEQAKIDILKRRIEIYKNASDYFKKALS